MLHKIAQVAYVPKVNLNRSKIDFCDKDTRKASDYKFEIKTSNHIISVCLGKKFRVKNYFVKQCVVKSGCIMKNNIGEKMT